MSAPAKAERHGTTSMRWRRHPICVLTTAKGRAHRATAGGVVVRVQTAQTVETIAPRSATEHFEAEQADAPAERPASRYFNQPVALEAVPPEPVIDTTAPQALRPEVEEGADTPEVSASTEADRSEAATLAAAVRAVETAQSLPPAHARPPRLVHAVRVLG